jgi:hypothetical protein
VGLSLILVVSDIITISEGLDLGLSPTRRELDPVWSRAVFLHFGFSLWLGA